MKQKFLLAYVPVLQSSYIRFFTQHRDAHEFFVLGEDILETFAWLRKDIRALSPDQAAAGLREILQAEQVSVPVSVINMQSLRARFSPSSDYLVMPDEDIMHALATAYFRDVAIQYDSVFLRWDAHNTTQHQVVQSDKAVPYDAFLQRWMRQALDVAAHSKDWWRQVGAVLVRDQQVVLQAFNHHVPDEYQPLYQGDPRGNFHKGVNVELGTAIHAEAAVIAQAACEGIPLAGTAMYVTTFPCPSCAKLIAYSGIATLYFKDGYSMVDGESILKARGVEIIHLSQS